MYLANTNRRITGKQAKATNTTHKFKHSGFLLSQIPSKQKFGSDLIFWFVLFGIFFLTGLFSPEKSLMYWFFEFLFYFRFFELYDVILLFCFFEVFYFFFSSSGQLRELIIKLFLLFYCYDLAGNLETLNLLFVTFFLGLFSFLFVFILNKFYKLLKNK